MIGGRGRGKISGGRKKEDRPSRGPKERLDFELVAENIIRIEGKNRALGIRKGSGVLVLPTLKGGCDLVEKIPWRRKKILHPAYPKILGQSTEEKKAPSSKN